MTEAAPKRSYSRDEVCRLLGVRESVLEGWELHGFVKRLDSYAFRDLIALQTLRQLRKNRVRPERVARILTSVRARLRDVKDPLTELKIYTDGRRVSVQVDGGRMEPISGQLLLDFDKAEIRRLLQFPAQPAEDALQKAMAQKQAEAMRWFEKGVELEQAGAPPEQSISAYQRALEYEPATVGALVNLGTLHYNLRRWAEAGDFYRKAVEADPEYALAHFNLGNLHDELGDWARALEHYLIALRLQPDYADVHYNVALLYQGHGETMKAVRHWRAYLKIDPGGYWADIARRELSRLRQETVLPGARIRS